MTTQTPTANEILETSISIHDISTAPGVAKHVLDLGPSAARITKIHISTAFSDSEDTFTEEQISHLTSPIAQLLTTISLTGGSLTHFTWSAPSSTSTPFTRPASFWSALYAHSTTLEFLQLCFFEHEVHHLPAPPHSFPCLKTLKLDTSSAHGDTGTSIHALLCACPALTTLVFEWPGCDLETCQIQNINWDEYTWTGLKELELNGWDFAPTRLAALLGRHKGVEVFRDGVDGPYVDEHASHIPLDGNVFPKLQTLRKRRGDARRLAEYFDPRANRPIRRLILDIRFNAARTLGELSACEGATTLEELELRGDVGSWRCKAWESDSSEDEEQRKTRKTKEAETPPIFMALRTLLEKLTALRELAIELDSGNTFSKNSKTGEWESDAPPNQDDLERLLVHIPHATSLRSLRLGDESVDELDQAWVQDMRGVPDSLEILGWGKEIFTIERVDGRIRGVIREGEVWRGWDER
jgi:hypothetical protein